MNLGGPEIVILLAVVLLLFGSSKVPQLARSLGSAKREFETAQKDGDAADASSPLTDAKAA